MSLSELHHITRTTKNWAEILVLDTGSVIDAEADAMLQALHSRSIWWIKSHLEVLAEKGADNFMSKFYVGYGHKSIGDCWTVTVFIENVSLLVCKAIQDTKLYSGQESSTRYIDYSQQAFIDPSHSEKGKALLEEQRAFYLSLLPQLNEAFKASFPREESQSEALYNKAIAAKSFDVARGFLVAGAANNLARHTNLRQLSDRLLYLRHHPLAEVREVAEALEDAMIEKYPNSFSKKRYEETETYMQEAMKAYYFHQPMPEFQVTRDDINMQQLKKAEVQHLIASRPNGKTELPTRLNNLWTISFQYLLDFGSRRDIQRQRSAFQRMPLLTDELGFNQRYLSQLPETLQQTALKYLEDLKKKVAELWLSKEEEQYYLPMGYNVASELMAPLPSLVYVCEIRTSQTVHPTLRKIAQKMSQYLMDTHQIKMFVDMSKYAFDIKRGSQDITLK